MTTDKFKIHLKRSVRSRGLLRILLKRQKMRDLIHAGKLATSINRNPSEIRHVIDRISKYCPDLILKHEGRKYKVLELNEESWGYDQLLSDPEFRTLIDPPSQYYAYSSSDCLVSLDDLPWRLLNSEKGKEELKVLFIFGTGRPPTFHEGLISDTSWLPEIISYLTNFAIQMKVAPSRIGIRYCTDIDIVRDRISKEILSEYNLISLGSGLVNRFLPEVEKKFPSGLYAFFSKRDDYSLVTTWNDYSRTYYCDDRKEGYWVGGLQVLANYFSEEQHKPERLIIIVAGNHRTATIASLRALYGFLTTPLYRSPSFFDLATRKVQKDPRIELNRRIQEIPVKIVRALPDESFGLFHLLGIEYLE